jgi:ATP-dependent helicase HrpA
VQDAVADLRSQRARLVGPGFVGRTGERRLPDLLRYLQAAQRRLDRLGDDVERDRRSLRVVQDLEREYRDVVAGLPAVRREAPDVLDVGWLLEELRVGLFAQPMRTARPVSEKRVLAALDALA